ncbi:alpha/beta fold hydrolase [bacterium]|nr:alpha/beta fold hydrolase [bacterium]QQR56772.1 MAG: alpha/beta fold hydrolase [Candidatus Melainabacteria bacterium]
MLKNIVEIEWTEEKLALEDGFLHINIWNNSKQPTQRIMILIHGLLMHGKYFESLALHLAEFGSLVAAPDLRGFGNSHFGEEPNRLRIDYHKSCEDLSRLIEHMQGKFGDLPIFLVGESLGALLARSVVGSHNKHVSGLILSSPCIRPRILSMDLIPHAISEAVRSALDRQRELNLAPFACKFLEAEPENLKDYLDDPLTRKSLDALELLESIKILGSIEPQEVPSHIPVLVLRGSNDGVCKNSSYKQFVSSLRNERLTVHDCNRCGHLILETKSIGKDIIESVLDWLKKH